VLEKLNNLLRLLLKNNPIITMHLNSLGLNVDHAKKSYGSSLIPMLGSITQELRHWSVYVLNEHFHEAILRGNNGCSINQYS